MRVYLKTHPADQRPREIMDGEEVTSSENAVLIAGRESAGDPLATQVKWREVEEGQPTDQGGWNGPYRVAAGRELGDGPTGIGFTGRRTQEQVVTLFEVCVTSTSPGARQMSFFLRPRHEHLDAGEVRQMQSELGGLDYTLDHRVAGWQGGRRETATEVTTSHQDPSCLTGGPLSQAREIERLWPELLACFEACKGKLPSRPTTRRTLSAAHQARQDPASMRRNLIEGRVDSRGRPMRQHLHSAGRTRDLDTPTAADLMEGARRAGRAREALIRQLEALRGESARETEELIQQGQWKENRTGKPGTIEHHLSSQHKDAGEVLDSLQALRPLHVPEELRHLRSQPSDQTALALHDPDYQKWYRLQQALERRVGARQSIERLRRLEGSALRRTWELYEYWVAYRLYLHLKRTLRFQPDEANTWKALELEDGDLTYGLGVSRSILLEHPSGLKVMFSVQPSIQVPGELREQVGRETIRPDLVLKLCGKKRDLQDSPSPRALIVDAKMQDLDPRWNGRIDDNRQARLSTMLQKSAYDYQEVIENHRTRPMAFLVHPGRRGARAGERPVTSKDRFHAWPARRGTGPGDIPEGLEPGDVPYHTGVALVRPSGAVLSESIFGQSDIHRMITAWLIENRVFWICVHCGHDLSGEDLSVLHQLAQDAHLKRESGQTPSARKARPPSRAAIEKALGGRVKNVTNAHLVCPCCRRVVVISHCETRNHPDETPPVIFKQFGDLESQSRLSQDQWANWSHEEIVSQGRSAGANALWDRPCPGCGNERR